MIPRLLCILNVGRTGLLLLQSMVKDTHKIKVCITSCRLLSFLHGSHSLLLAMLAIVLHMYTTYLFLEIPTITFTLIDTDFRVLTCLIHMVRPLQIIIE